MKTKAKFLVLMTVFLLLFTISAFSLAILKTEVILLPFAVLGLVLTVIFKIKLNKVI